MVKIGKEVFVELSQDEAMLYIGKKEKVLTNRIDSLTEQAAQVKAHIAFVIILINDCRIGYWGKSWTIKHKYREALKN